MDVGTCRSAAAVALLDRARPPRGACLRGRRCGGGRRSPYGGGRAPLRAGERIAGRRSARNSPAFDARVRGAVARLPEVRGVPARDPAGDRGHPPSWSAVHDDPDHGARSDDRRPRRRVRGPTPGRRSGGRRDHAAALRDGNRIDDRRPAVDHSGRGRRRATRSRPGRRRPELHGPPARRRISKAVSSDADWTPSSGFWRKYGPRTPAFVNMFVGLRNGDADFDRFQADVQRVAHQTINVERAGDILGTRKAQSVTGVEEDGLLIFALAALVGGAVLVGQALVRARHRGRRRPSHLARHRGGPPDRRSRDGSPGADHRTRRGRHWRRRGDRDLVALSDRGRPPVRARPGNACRLAGARGCCARARRTRARSGVARGGVAHRAPRARRARPIGSGGHGRPARSASRVHHRIRAWRSSAAGAAPPCRYGPRWSEPLSASSASSDA